MNEHPAETQDDASSRLTAPEVVRLLQVGVTGPPRPVDRVIERLHEIDGARWFTHALGVVGRLTAFDMPVLPDDAPDIEAVTRCKETARRATGDAPTHDVALCATLGYLLFVGAALAHHGQNISSRAREELDSILTELADVLPEAWQKMLLSAVLVP